MFSVRVNCVHSKTLQKQPPEVFHKKCVLKACNFTKKETLAKAFLCEFEKLLRAPTSQNTSR